MSDFSQRNMSLVPRSAIAWIVGRMHVGTPDAAVESAIRGRIRKGTSERTIKACVKYALRCHTANRKLYSRVMGGI